MRTATAISLLAAAALWVLGSGAAAEEPPVETNAVLAELKPGEHWSGPEIALEDLQGKVVLFVLWGS